MNVKFLHCSIVSILLAIISYAIITLLNITLTSAIAVSVSIFVSGMIVPALAAQFSVTAQSNAGARTNSVEEPDGDITTLYVGNLPYRANEEAVKAYFQDHTNVQSVRLMKDKRTGKRKGYGFVEVISSDVDKAITTLNDSVFQDRTLKVRHAKDKVAH
ncbi:RNA recognition motif domain-containing protein [Alteromonas oceanisediminis]|uniref:RNA recognition motif domain-containing protein n=1 Tax=Alteromonas oceanisediminis TaxID=2836180 RepID=UPI001BD91846|nr:RNA-binding protein [Alteromonas oceanisediminis]MBT0585843.1 RNA-binding protein [Alteromonas oceanisediminis]